MPGFNELIAELEKKHPDDWWIKSRRDTESLFPDSFPQVHIYENALRILDSDSWLVLSEKAHDVFPGPQGARGKNQFFNLLNEALAYEYLAGQELRNIRLLLPVPKKKTPDISYDVNGMVRYCEVKTISVSEEELGRIGAGEAFDSSIYYELTPEFLDKLGSTIQNAAAQIKSFSPSGLIYVIVHFDDFSLVHYDTYQRQISDFLACSFPALEIIVRVGVLGAHYIRHGVC
ncbi:hypothetical protein IMF27_21475 [Pseudomonas sp. PCH199]|uniref:hypothetical protein n=1 Tax=unclassified Pseudomonas TaxID=196821 RepID=UPI000FFBF358|nr:MULTISPECIES: hypothetical protein [unclassified Pseudomonas]MCW8277839.1 hypothetical protein [Pseudomonas sp. PCH199]